jgi:hypothetical protein
LIGTPRAPMLGLRYRGRACGLGPTSGLAPATEQSRQAACQQAQVGFSAESSHGAGGPTTATSNSASWSRSTGLTPAASTSASGAPARTASRMATARPRAPQVAQHHGHRKDGPEPGPAGQPAGQDVVQPRDLPVPGGEPVHQRLTAGPLARQRPRAPARWLATPRRRPRRPDRPAGASVPGSSRSDSTVQPSPRSCASSRAQRRSPAICRVSSTSTAPG